MSETRQHINPAQRQLQGRIMRHKRAITELTKLYKLRQQRSMIESRIERAEEFMKSCGFGQDL